MTKHKVVLVPFPFDDLSATKVRPAVCLTEPIGPHRHVILAFITSQVLPDPLATDLVIDSRDDDFALTGPRVASTLQALVGRALGWFSPLLNLIHDLV